MFDIKTVEQLLKKGFTQKTIFEVETFLENNNSELVNLAGLGDSDYRIIFKELTTGKVDARIFKFSI
jgi:hypothetical protein